MKNYEKEITKEQYEKVMSLNPRGFVVDSIKDEFFTISQICGYGIYSARVFIIDDKYILSYSMGSSCD